MPGSEDPVRDAYAPQPVSGRTDRFAGLRWSVRTDTVDLATGAVPRDYLVHPGAVGIMALDDRERLLFVRQYRHPVGYLLWEPPAGLMDVADEPPLSAAQRELVEEAGLVAAKWHVLADWFNSPGGSSEAFRCFLARGLAPAPDGRPQGEAEEHDMPMTWLPLDRAVQLVLSGRLNNPTAVAGVLATAAARERGWQGLRPPDSPWLVRENLLAGDRVWLPQADD